MLSLLTSLNGSFVPAVLGPALGTLAGAAYFVVARLLAARARWLDPLTAGYLYGAPFAVGFLAVTAAAAVAGASWLTSAALPWLAVALGLAGQLLLRLHRLLSVFMALPAFLLFSALGGLLAHGLAAVCGGPMGVGFTALVVLLPLALAVLETRFPPAGECREVHTETVVRARAETIWANVVRVAPIAPGEWALYRVLALLGFPAPEQAVLSHDGVGGLRQGIFSGTVLFDEPVLAWEPGACLRLAVHARPDAVAAMPFDDCTRIGGRYFGMVTAEYRLLPLDRDHVLVQLNTVHRLTSRLNEYAGWWSRLVLRTFQQSILALIKRRCEELEASRRSSPAIVTGTRVGVRQEPLPCGTP
jgi:hypothetical protein